MRVPIYTVVVPFFAALVFAQDTPPPAPQQPADTAAPSTADKTAKSKSKDKNPDKAMDKDKTMDKTAATAPGDRLEEMKTQTYSGTLMDASCAGSSSAPAPTSASADRAASSADKTSADSASCPVSASTTKFALKTKDGQTVKFDDVGNMRAQEALKAKKKWTESAAASKPIRVKASGVLNGDRLTVMSIN
jgi:hypothetical protein